MGKEGHRATTEAPSAATSMATILNRAGQNQRSWTPSITISEVQKKGTNNSGLRHLAVLATMGPVLNGIAKWGQHIHLASIGLR